MLEMRSLKKSVSYNSIFFRKEKVRCFQKHIHVSTNSPLAV